MEPKSLRQIAVATGGAVWGSEETIVTSVGTDSRNSTSQELFVALRGERFDGHQFIEAARGMKWVSPRGPISIDPATRDIVQTVYIRKVEKVGDKLQNVEFDQVPDFKDPGKP